ncbi:MAG TPA: hypothetical protein VFH31_14280 [Pyrinomonadaceae bacterium]|nr:hypothetical protein [Pyrinomonadaceae bacterium]
MKRWQKIVLVLFVLLSLSQIPFAYRRYQLGRLHSAITSFESQRQTLPVNDSLMEYRGVFHVHSFLGGHSSGTFQEIISAANSNKLDFVVMTEHPARDFNTAEMTLRGAHNGVLFINGNEVKTALGDRLLLIPGDQQAGSDSDWTTKEVLNRRGSGLEFVAYPEEFKSWEVDGITGIEVYNVYTNARKINPLRMLFDSLWSYRTYPDLLFATFYERPSESLRQWDREISRSGKKLVAVAGNDSHSNVGVSLNDSSGQPLIGLRLDPYERSFRLVRLHVLVPSLLGEHSIPRPLEQESLLAAIAGGHCFVGFDLFGDTSGFRFAARDHDENKIMGDEIRLDDEVRLTASLPIAARVMLLKDGMTIKDEIGVNVMEFVAKEKGSYRVEVYLAQLPGRVKDQPWIISNPIYVK